MATTYYVLSTGSATAPYDTWAKAATTVETIDGIDATGDIIYVSNNHNPTASGTAINWAFAGSGANFTRLICADDTSTPATTASEGAQINTSGAAGVTITGDTYVRGLYFNIGTGTTSGASFTLGSSGTSQTLDKCRIRLNNSNAGNRISYGQTTATNGFRVRMYDCQWKFSSVSQMFAIRAGNLKIRGGQFETGSSAITNFCFLGATATGKGCNVVVEGADLSGGATAMNLVSTIDAASYARFENCKLPASWSGQPVGSTMERGAKVEMFNCDSSGTNIRYWGQDYSGDVKSETTIVRSGGASDGTTTYSYNMTTNATSGYPHFWIESPEFAVWNSTTGSSKTVTVEFVHDSATALTNQDIWLEVDYLGSSTSPLGTIASSRNTNPVGSGTNYTSSSATWTTTGMANPNKQYMTVTLNSPTPGQAGFFKARVCLAKPSYTVYIDPKMTVS